MFFGDDLQMVLEGIGGNGYRGDMAVDDIRLDHGACTGVYKVWCISDRNVDSPNPLQSFCESCPRNG